MPLSIARLDDATDDRPVAPPDTAIRVPILDLRPTQATVGMRAVAFKRRKIEKRVERARIDTFLQTKPIPSVRGPGGHLFMIDHHHLGLALWQAEVEAAYVCIIEDLSVLPVHAFWSRMEQTGRVHPFDADGRRLEPTRLPDRLNALCPDPYRDLAWSVREAGGFAKSPLPFAEFRWAEYFRTWLPERLVRTDYERAVSRAKKLARGKAAADLPGYLPR
jgi:hypothetical protein